MEFSTLDFPPRERGPKYFSISSSSPFVFFFSFSFHETLWWVRRRRRNLFESTFPVSLVLNLEGKWVYFSPATSGKSCVRTFTFCKTKLESSTMKQGKIEKTRLDCALNVLE